MNIAPTIRAVLYIIHGIIHVSINLQCYNNGRHHMIANQMKKMENDDQMKQTVYEDTLQCRPV